MVEVVGESVNAVRRGNRVETQPRWRRRYTKYEDRWGLHGYI